MVKFLKYKETEIPFSIGYYALKRFKQETGAEFKSLNLDDISNLEVLFWYAIEAGYKHTQKENPFKREEVEMILDEVLSDVINSMPDFFPTPQEKKT